QGGLVGQRRALQPGEDKTWRDCGQDGCEEELGPVDAVVAEGRAGEAAQLSQGRTVREYRRGRGDLHNGRALAREPEVPTHSVPVRVLQARYQDSYSGPRAAARGIQRQGSLEPESARRAGADRAG
ncbi:hypothetical protein LTR87_018103, partial [Friedmanniomyces endolithicus]